MDNAHSREKNFKRKEYNLIRSSNTSLIHQKIRSNIKIALNILLKENTENAKYIGIYWPLKGEIDIRFLKHFNNQKVALPSSSKKSGLNYHPWSKRKLKLDQNNIPSPLEEKKLCPADISLLLVPAIAIDLEGYRLGYGGGYFDRLRKKNIWRAIPSFVVASQDCVSENPLPRDSWDIPFNGWISENGLHKIETTK